MARWGPDVHGCSAAACRPHQIHLQPPPRTTHKRGKNIAGLSNEIIPTSRVHAQRFLAGWRPPPPRAGPGVRDAHTEATFIPADGRLRTPPPPQTVGVCCTKHLSSSAGEAGWWPSPSPNWGSPGSGGAGWCAAPASLSTPLPAGSRSLGMEAQPRDRGRREGVLRALLMVK